MTNRRYQVFVSSTYEDLQEERREVMQALLELGCIPAGMELFPAANDDQWTLIKRVIDDCDYYIVVIAGRYGSVDADGVSYTEKEYRYALERGKPVIAFLHASPGEISARFSEQSADGQSKLSAFKELTKRKMVKFWRTPADLGSVVSRSLVNLIQTNPGVGWVRADKLLSPEASEELLRLRRTIDHLEAQLVRTRTSGPDGTSDLAQGEDSYAVPITFRSRKPGDYKSQILKGTYRTTWNRIFSVIAPVMVGHASETDIRRALLQIVGEEFLAKVRSQNGSSGQIVDGAALQDAGFHDIMLQLRALGLIEPSSKARSVKDTATYWGLTSFGDATMMKLRAIRRTGLDEPNTEGSRSI